MKFSESEEMSVSDSLESRTLLLTDAAMDGVVDYKGLPAFRFSSGGWRSAYFIIGMEVAEKFAFYGISSNLITYLTGPLDQSMVTAAEIVNSWSGTSMLLALLGAFVADSFLGRYRTIVFASALYILGLSLMTLSALIPSMFTSEEITSNSTSKIQVILFFVSLYIIAIGSGGHRPCVHAFGADQFDGQNPEESKSKRSFFNWWFFGLCVGAFITIPVVTYIQENFSWSLGFGIPCAAMVIALLVFVLGTKTYRYSSSLSQNEKSPFVRIGRVFVAAILNFRTTAASPIAIEEDENGRRLLKQIPQQFKFLDKACFVPNDTNQHSIVCSMSDVEEAKSILKVVPIWFSNLIFTTVCSQASTFFTKQAATTNRSITSNLTIPAASLQSFLPLSIIVFVSLYELAFVPIARTLFTQRLQSGITTLQRIGTGMVISVFTMIIAALVEIKRLKTAREHGLVDTPDATIPMSFWWLVPQYILFGLADVFTAVGLQEFFYSEVPKDFKSMGLAFYGSLFGVGDFLSTFLVYAIDQATKVDGNNHGWFSNNLNKSHLDYFYFLLAGLSALGFIVFLFISKSYVYYRENII